MKYIALLRGINVGGNSLVSMKQLKELFETLGLEAVRTYINSGNVLFESKLTAAKLSPKIEAAIEHEFKFPVSVVVKSQSEIEAIAKVIPDNWQNNTEMKTDVMFLWADVDDRSTLKQLQIKPELDHVTYVKGAIIWHVLRKHVTRSGLLKIVGTPLYKKMTIRNVNTFRKLQKMLAE